MNTPDLSAIQTRTSDAADDVIRLRVWGTDGIHLLPSPPLGPCLIGNASSCAVRIVDPFIAPKHAQLTFDGEQWWIRDRGTPQGLRQDGVLRERFALTPGCEIGVGATTLIAESRRSAQLRAFVQRLLGWDGKRLPAVDHALRAIQLARAHRAALVLVGDGDLVPIAYALHRHTLGDAAPFIVCDRRRRDTRASVRAPANLPSGLEAYSAAVGGTLCVRHPPLPADMDEVLRRAYEPDSNVQLVVCTRDHRHGAVLSGPMAIHLPPLQIREAELPRIVEEYASEAIASLRAPADSFTDDDRWWVMRHAARSLSEIEKATLRIVAVATTPNLSQAAEQLGMAAVSLTRWLHRRPPRLPGEEPARSTAGAA